MDEKDTRLLIDECKLTDAIPAEMTTGSVFAVEYLKYIRELKSEFQLWKDEVDRGRLSEEDVGLLCKEKLLQNVRTRRSKWYWMFSGNTKIQMTKNRLRHLFLGMLEGHIQGRPEATTVVHAWLEDE